MANTDWNKQGAIAGYGSWVFGALSIVVMVWLGLRAPQSPSMPTIPHPAMEAPLIPPWAFWAAPLIYGSFILVAAIFHFKAKAPKATEGEIASLKAELKNETNAKMDREGRLQQLRIHYDELQAKHKTLEAENVQLLRQVDTFGEAARKLDVELSTMKLAEQVNKKQMRWPDLRVSGPKGVGFIEPNVLGVALEMENAEMRYPSTVHNIRVSFRLTHEADGTVIEESNPIWYDIQQQKLFDDGPRSLGMQEWRCALLFCRGNTVPPFVFHTVGLPPAVWQTGNKLEYGTWKIEATVVADNFEAVYVSKRVGLKPSGLIDGLENGIHN